MDGAVTRAVATGIVALTTGLTSLASAVGIEPFRAGFLGVVFLLMLALSWAGFEAARIFGGHPPGRTIRRQFKVAALLIVSVIVTQWPLRLNFLLTRGSLDQLIARVERGDQVPMPTSIGLFRIERAEIRYGGYPMLVLSVDPTGPTGLVRSHEEPGNAWSVIRLGGDWILYCED